MGNNNFSSSQHYSPHRISSTQKPAILVSQHNPVRRNSAFHSREPARTELAAGELLDAWLRGMLPMWFDFCECVHDVTPDTSGPDRRSFVLFCILFRPVLHASPIASYILAHMTRFSLIPASFAYVTFGSGLVSFFHAKSFQRKLDNGPRKNERMETEEEE